MDKADKLFFEREMLAVGAQYIAGADEVGRGPLAGPVVCAAVIMPLGRGELIEGIDDSKALKEKEGLTVITNSMEILIELSDVSGWNIISTGGVMKEGYLAFLGSRTEDAIRSYYVDKMFFSCKALDPEWGIMESQEAFGSTKKAMLSSGRRKILVVDSTKFDQTAFSVAGKLRDVDVVVTDRKPSEKWLARFTDAGIECRYPES